MNEAPNISSTPGAARMTKVNPIPKGYHEITPYLVVKGAAKAIDFYRAVFGATEVMRMPGPKGTLLHAEIKFGTSTVMLADETPGMEFKGPESIGGSPVGILVYVSDVDVCAAKAIAAGAKQIRPVENQFYGDRSGTFADPFGHLWTIATHVEDVTPEEMRRRISQMKSCE